MPPTTIVFALGLALSGGLAFLLPFRGGRGCAALCCRCESRFSRVSSARRGAVLWREALSSSRFVSGACVLSAVSWRLCLWVQLRRVSSACGVFGMCAVPSVWIRCGLGCAPVLRFGVFWLAASASGLSEGELLLSRALWIPAVAASDVAVAFMLLADYRCSLLCGAPLRAACISGLVFASSLSIRFADSG